ncbi:MAG: carboxymuconolactone decarboxylase family protein [Janthinobacterium lividum]
MNAETDEKNLRLPLLEPAALNPDQREMYERIASGMLPWAKQSGFQAETEDGSLLGPFNAYLYSPELGSAQLNYLNTERDATAIDARVREVVILTVGAVFESKYELYAHRAVAAKAGLAAEDIDALASGREPGAETRLTPEEVTAYRFVRAVSAEHRVSPELFAEAQKAFGHKGLIDMLHLAGLYMSISSLLNAFDVPVPE